MLPLGIIEFGRQTRFTPDEQRTMMTLWSIARSPLILGSDLTRLDAATLALLTNDEVLAVNQHSANNHQLRRTPDGIIIWTADAPEGKGKFLAVFNTSDREAVVPVKLADLALTAPAIHVRDLWARRDLAPAGAVLTSTLPAHGSALFLLRPR